MSCEPYLDPFLAVCAVKFLRACLSAESEHYARIFIRHNIFRPILNLLKSSLITYAPSSRCEGSLLESVLLEFFNFLSTSIESSPSIASLVKCLVSFCKSIIYSWCFKTNFASYSSSAIHKNVKN
jgi:hypothetical protein